MQLHLLHNTPNAYFEIFYLFWCWKTKSKFSASRNITQSSQDFFRMRYLVTTLVHSFEFMETQCEKTRNLHWHILNKNFVIDKLSNKRVDFMKYFSMRCMKVNFSQCGKTRNSLPCKFFFVKSTYSKVLWQSWFHGNLTKKWWQ